MKAVAAALLLTLAALSAHAAIVDARFDPPAADDRHSVDLLLFGEEPTSCVPGSARVVRNGTTIEVHLASLGSACLSAPFYWRYAAPLGVLDAGVYDVAASIDNSKAPAVHATLIVRATEPFRVRPFAIPVSGGTVSLEGGAFFETILGVKFGDRYGSSPGLPTADRVPAPPHPPGTVDVTVLTSTTATATAAVTYYDPAAEPDPALFEPVLFPVAYNGAGWLGSQWVTENLLLSSEVATYFRTPLPCNGCTARVDSSVLALDGNSAAGILLWAVRGTTAALIAQSRVGEVARGGGWTEVPVVRESDFRWLPWSYGSKELRLLNVRLPENARATLRVWALDDPGTVFGPATLTPTRSAPGEPYFAMADVTDALRRSPDVYLNAQKNARVWAMLSITDNETQRVTVVTPN